MDQALDLMRRLPPSNIEENLTALVDLAPELTEELLSRVDQPLQIAFDNTVEKEFLMCDYNRDGDSYRSPWTGTYFPPMEGGALPSPALRTLELQANATFDTYRDQYFEGGVSSVYLWDILHEDEDESAKAKSSSDDIASFAGCFLIKKDAQDGKRSRLSSGYWDSIHVVEVNAIGDDGVSAIYKLTSTVMLSLNTQDGIKLGGSLTRQMEEIHPVIEGHIVNIGTMLEEMEGKLRNSLDQVYFGKTRDVVSALRVSTDDAIQSGYKENMARQACLISEMLAKNPKAS
mmetsp:Transcript_35975/g.49946  ORF Transcript_35975/g.49946 Transcript_35975/m.49946 type:complete len:288 (+) Transcript_35975:165-1028(+)|eukprot:CAMPEP_0196588394 /NCGR_PEP_ID=MMETSP1081-20130531/60415_1 /TAXON_ID=36882 /ORGANISM="Pyramimonas amylifera, Strain CCMP720" /LENGTH=287 /DNA_ID=CAMNT_0041910877 /DNA_START=163 /DNA_END=1026 /DNA_ORIENTATION=-